MVAFLVGEGPNDIGGLSRPPGHQTDTPGFLQPVVRKALDCSPAFRGRKLASLPRNRLRGATNVLTHKAAAAAAIAETQGADILVIVTDLDGRSAQRDRRQARRMLEVKRRALRQGVKGFTSAVGVPCRTVEAWALGDLNALKMLFGDGVDAVPAGSPEDLWGGSRDADSNHPKQVLRRVVGRKATTDDLNAIAEASDLAVLRDRCPMSFDPFATDLAAA